MTWLRRNSLLLVLLTLCLTLSCAAPGGFRLPEGAACISYERGDYIIRICIVKKGGVPVHEIDHHIGEPKEEPDAGGAGGTDSRGERGNEGNP